MLSGAMAGATYWVGLYPIDCVKTKIQMDDFHNPKYKGLFDCLKKSIQTEGIKSLYKGVLPCAIRAIVTNAFGFVAYEYVKEKIEGK